MLTGDLTTAPATAASGNATLTLGGSDIQADFVVVDGDLYATLTPNKWSDFGKASDIYDVSVILNPDIGLANALANFTNAKAEGRDTINGQDAVSISGNFSRGRGEQGRAAVHGVGAGAGHRCGSRRTGDHQLVQASLEKSSGNTLQMTMSNWGAPVSVTKPPVTS